MPRKPVKPSRASKRAKRPSDIPPQRIRIPRQWRVVTAQLVHVRTPGKSARTAPRYVPQIRLSGAWLERVGFPKGRGYLISVDRPFETIILQAAHDEDKIRRRR
jgi:hypothetical protein